MKSKKGLFLIAITTLITALLWLFAVPNQPMVPLDRARHVVAGLALNGFFLIYLLSTRNTTLEKWFNGLDKMLIYHKVIAICILLLLLIHVGLGDLLQSSDQVGIQVVLGNLAMLSLVLLVGIALFAQGMVYEKWQITHHWIILSYGIGLIHTYTSSHISLISFSPVSIWTAATALIGLLLAVYSIFYYQEKHFLHLGKVTKITRLSPKVVEWEITLDKPLHFNRGQFVLVQVFQQGFEHGPHPFSISGGDENKIVLTTKVAGDFTKQLYDSLEFNTWVAVEGPYGCLNFSQGKQKQLWVADGIGITAFISYLREEHPDQQIDLYYSYQGVDAALYKDLITEYQKKNENFTAHFVDTSISGPLSFERYTLKNDTDVFMCGPEKMVLSFLRSFKRNNLHANIYFEALSTTRG